MSGAAHSSGRGWWTRSCNEANVLAVRGIDRELRSPLE